MSTPHCLHRYTDICGAGICREEAPGAKMTVVSAEVVSPEGELYSPHIMLEVSKFRKSQQIRQECLKMATWLDMLL